MLESFGISKILTEKEISENLNSIFPKLKFRMTDYELIENIQLNKNEIAFIVHSTESDFPIRIELLLQIKTDTEEREQFIANRLSKNLDCKTIVGYQESNSVNPFLNLVFENGKTFLANDAKTKYAEDGEDLIKIIKEVSFVVDWNFDEFGNKIKR